MEAPYNFMHALGFGADAIFSMKDNSNLAISFISATELNQGTVVRLNGAMTVEAITVATQTPFGIVITSEQKTDGTWRCVVQTQFQALVRGRANGVVAVNADVAASDYHTASKLMRYEAAGANTVVGVALTAGADTDEIIIGIKRSF